MIYSMVLILIISLSIYMSSFIHQHRKEKKRKEAENRREKQKGMEEWNEGKAQAQEDLTLIQEPAPPQKAYLTGARNGFQSSKVKVHTPTFFRDLLRFLRNFTLHQSLSRVDDVGNINMPQFIQ